MTTVKKKFYLDHTGMCITYLLTLKKMEYFLEANGWESVDSIEECDCAILGACASFLPFFDEYRKSVQQINQLKKELIVYGCIPFVNEQFHKEIVKDIKLLIPLKSPELLESIVPNPQPKWNDIADFTVFRRKDYASFSEKKRFVVIQEGCSSNCLCCPHKIVIGSNKSKTREDVLSQILKEENIDDKIFILAGEDAGSWGTDLSPKDSYAELVNSVIEAAPHSEIHLDNVAPKWVIANEKAFESSNIKDIKIPIQTASKRLLSLINRDTTSTELKPLLQALKKKNPDVHLRTEIIIGLPTETEEELKETLEFVVECFDKVACYSFDYHPDAPIAKKNIPLFDAETIKKRVLFAMEFLKDKDIAAVFSFGEVLETLK